MLIQEKNLASAGGFSRAKEAFFWGTARGDGSRLRKRAFIGRSGQPGANQGCEAHKKGLEPLMAPARVRQLFT